MNHIELDCRETIADQDLDNSFDFLVESLPSSGAFDEAMSHAASGGGFQWTPSQWETDRSRRMCDLLGSLVGDCPSTKVPPDIAIHCADGTVFGHKLVLAMHSEFFRVKFRIDASSSASGFGAVGPGSVDITNFPTDLMETLKIWMYSGKLPPPEILVKKFYGLIYLSNYLLIPTMIDILAGFFHDLAMNSYIGVNGIMTIYRLGQRLGETQLTNIVAKFFHFLTELPEGFETVDFEHFFELIQRFQFSSAFTAPSCLPHHMIRAMTSCAGLSALPRERFILGWIVKFLRHDKPRRLKYATLLFKQLKLAFIAGEIDFVALGLEELDDPAQYAELHAILRVCRVGPCHNLLLLEDQLQTSYYFTPRPNTIRYSIWSQRIGDFHLRNYGSQSRKRSSEDITDQNNNSGNLDVDMDESGIGKRKSRRSSAAPKKYTLKRFRFERSEAERIVQIDLFPKKVGSSFCDEDQRENEVVVAGIRLHWSDGTKDECGHIDESNKMECKLAPHEGVTVQNIQYSGFLEVLTLEKAMASYETSANQFLPPKARVEQLKYGPFGGQFKSNQPLGPRIAAARLLGNSLGFCNYNNLCFIDGLKGVELICNATKEKMVTGIMFKFSLQTNASFEHFVKAPPTHKKCRFTDPDLNVQPAADENQGPQGPFVRPSKPPDKPRSLTINFLKAENRYLQISDLREAYRRQDKKLHPDHDLFPNYII